MVLTVALGFCHEHALILYVYLPNDSGEEESVLTVCAAPATMLYLMNCAQSNTPQYYVSSYSA
jgi:hypothetical protein